MNSHIPARTHLGIPVHHLGYCWFLRWRVVSVCLDVEYNMAMWSDNGPLTRYVKLRVAHAPGMPGTFPRHRLQRKTLVSDPGMHHGTCVTHVPWCISGSLTRGGGENLPGIPGACATRNFTYLARGSCMRITIRAASSTTLFRLLVHKQFMKLVLTPQNNTWDLRCYIYLLVTNFL